MAHRCFIQTGNLWRAVNVININFVAKVNGPLEVEITGYVSADPVKGAATFANDLPEPMVEPKINSAEWVHGAQVKITPYKVPQPGDEFPADVEGETSDPAGDASVDWDPKDEQKNKIQSVGWAKRIAWFAASSLIGGGLYHTAIHWWNIL